MPSLSYHIISFIYKHDDNTVVDTTVTTTDTININNYNNNIKNKDNSNYNIILYDKYNKNILFRIYPLII